MARVFPISASGQDAVIHRRPASRGQGAGPWRWQCLAWLLLGLSASFARAAELEVGDTLPALGLQDPQGEERSVAEETALVLYSRDRAGDDLLDAVLGARERGAPATGDVVYIADISGMPGIITKLFALPAMRKRPYAMLLDHEGQATARFPFREEQVTLLRLQAGRITGIDFAADETALQKALGNLSD